VRAALIGLGANLPSIFGPPERSILAAADALSDRLREPVCLSGLWRSAPIPASDQPWFVNAVARAETALGPEAVLHMLQDIERAFGRDPGAPRNAARTLDLDLLALGDMVCAAAPILPHPRMDARAFVLHPLAEVAPDWTHPVTGRSVGALIAALPPQHIARVEVPPRDASA
jgi:2-amino-4-hydroxy-6-hydroxymethyldihydropteridine diphosphokinase